ncbi:MULTISPECIES: pantetheine-phosphate adenylyltransferase [Atopobiaceae]|uniref:Phosphopantetheine adenylyltransferase n=1 Tax=Parafannyhessea umbonata TaxID=604330 RepID=A0A1H9NJE4_9ACTN|nr:MULTISPECIES: pantetheine-phosphate adenylyltransferase [Atopobiaceae]SEH67712.1 Phosphopantetheine adenylyltransferase [Parafannyhessea umbonata]SER36022.1 Phosphopantetheine adenylyltransferase [Parafannyhessea umbonata]SJZ88636.1 Phosphopantetheine adenylyltransferase [Olsenella sp. KH1P3]
MADSVIEHVVVPGTFDPVTFGHLDVIRRARRLFPRVTVGVAASVGKNGVGPTFSLDERVRMLLEALELEGISERVDVRPFSGLLVAFCQEVGAGGVVKGLRAMTDFEYELQQADLNSQLAPQMESIFVMSNPKYGYVSSSIVRELASLGSDVSFLVPKNVAAELARHFSA